MVAELHAWQLRQGYRLYAYGVFARLMRATLMNCQLRLYQHGSTMATSPAEKPPGNGEARRHFVTYYRLKLMTEPVVTRAYRHVITRIVFDAFRCPYAAAASAS